MRPRLPDPDRIVLGLILLAAALYLAGRAIAPPFD